MTAQVPSRVEAGTKSRRLAPWPLTKRDALTIAWAAVVMFGVTVAAGLIVTQLLASTGLVATDVAISEWFAARRTATFDRLTDLGSAFSDTITIVIALLVVGPVLVLTTRRWKDAVLVALAVALETTVFVATAFVVGRDRPPVEQLDVSPPTASFPSGHTGAAVAFYVGLALVIFWWTRRKPVRIVTGTLAMAIPVIVALSRLYRGMHFTTDVIFGALVGLASVAVINHVLHRTQSSHDGVANPDEPVGQEQGVAA